MGKSSLDLALINFDPRADEYPLYLAAAPAAAEYPWDVILPLIIWHLITDIKLLQGTIKRLGLNFSRAEMRRVLLVFNVVIAV